MLADDYEIYRHGLRMILELEDDIVVVGQTSTAQQAMQVATELQPDVVVLDIYFPDGSGIAVCREITQRLPTARVLILSASEDDSDLVEAIKAGATGYLLKDIAPDQLAVSIRATALGQPQVSPALAATLMGELSAVVRGAPARESGQVTELTDREREVLGLVARGWSNRKVAEELFIAENTVKNHVRNILDKLHLGSRTEAAMYAVRGGLIDDPAHDTH
nr:response regulator transcription factor [Flexivirga oryzae]